MKIYLTNLRKMLELKEKNNYKDKVDYFYNTYPTVYSPFYMITFLLKMLFIMAFTLFIILLFINLKDNSFNINEIFIKQLSVFVVVFLILIIGFVITKIMVYSLVKDVFDVEIYAFSDELNEIYVDPNNNEKIYTLYELIKKHGLKRNKENQENDYFLTFELNTDIEYTKFKDTVYEDVDIKNVILEKVIPFKEVSENKCQTLFYEYIEQFLTGNKKSFDEKEEILKRITSLNDVKL